MERLKYSLRGVTHEQGVRWLANKVKELDFPFLEPLADEATAPELWKTQTQDIDLIGRLAYEPEEATRETSLVPLANLRKLCRAAPSSWLLCYSESSIEGYAHVEPIACSIGDEIWAGKKNESDIQVGHVRHDAQAGRNDYIHLGSIVNRRYKEGEKDLEVTARLFAGVADRIQLLSTQHDNSPRRVLAVSYPDRYGVDHLEQLLRIACSVSAQVEHRLR